MRRACWRVARLVTAVLVMGLAMLLGPDQYKQVEATELKLSDVSGHWAENTIIWGVALGIVNGFPDGSFQPDELVTEAQFTAMLFRLQPGTVPSVSEPQWYSEYYNKASEWNWPVTEANANVSILRGDVARVIAASQGSQLTTDAAVAMLLENKLAGGRGTIDGVVQFGEEEMLTRAEAVQFIRNLANTGRSIGAADKPPVIELHSDALISLSGIAVGDTEERLVGAMGQPAVRSKSEYGYDWYIYNSDYTQFSMYGVQDGRVVALYGNGSNMKLRGATAESGSEQARQLLGNPISSILKGRFLYSVGTTDGQHEVFSIDNAYVTVFYDLHQNGVISGIQVIEKETELALQGFYGPRSEELASSFERVVFELANSVRMKQHLSLLHWDDGAARTAVGHSEDMAVHTYFSHTSLQGFELADRLKAQEVTYTLAGENIAYGQTSAIFAHEGWMNSKTGHRENVLGNFLYLGVGVYFTTDDVPYYTQNFITR